MSEFSCSYHLKTESVDDCINLIKRANTTGFVFPARDGWISFVVDEPDFIFSKSLIDANDGILLNFINAEDHGWSFEVFNNSSKVCKFECDYDDGDDEEVFDESDELSFDDIDDFTRCFPQRIPMRNALKAGTACLITINPASLTEFLGWIRIHLRRKRLLLGILLTVLGYIFMNGFHIITLAQSHQRLMVNTRT